MSFAVGLIAVVAFALLAPAMQFMARVQAWPLAPVMLLALAAVVSHLLGVLLGVLIVPQFRYWDAASIFGFCVMGYVFAFGAAYKSVSLDILLGLVDRPGRTAPLSDVVDRQVPDLFRGRTKILIDGGLVEQVDSRFAATAAGQTMASRIGRLRQAFGIGNTGLYEFTD
ncbi:hypothetical protein QCM77_15705 [Bradyrhizobium sp. SSUT18]|uniref:hypothetical protein n=1 Tax=unclassified Bradyrhizobium TaxID=2631580 RepID=UPI002449DF40|nr:MULTISPECIES: hypothetical protein [unclassified Bradyrhizobium]MDH2351737.1 hypothetical protein [Bradyrhizobium sp. SSUT112]MDH2401385.1 hypothetical protein [Bradyrhizobium sp. SSUT18]